MHRVILDRSIFHGNKFSLLKQSAVQDCVHQNLVKVLYTSQFIEETLQFGLVDRHAFKEQWHFLLGLNSNKWFKHPEHIVAAELGNAIIGRKYYFLGAEEIQRLAQNSFILVNGLVPPTDLKTASQEMQRNKSLREQFRRTRLDARKSAPRQSYDFGRYFEENVEWYIENALMKFHDNSATFLNTWRQRRPHCRFSESFMRAWFSTIFLPIVDHGLKVDMNDKLDAEQLAYLEWADIIVSDDTKFMKAAFDLLYRNARKKFFCLSDFLLFLDNVAATAANKRQNGARTLDRRC